MRTREVELRRAGEGSTLTRTYLRINPCVVHEQMLSNNMTVDSHIEMCQRHKHLVRLLGERTHAVLCVNQEIQANRTIVECTSVYHMRGGNGVGVQLVRESEVDGVDLLGNFEDGNDWAGDVDEVGDAVKVGE